MKRILLNCVQINYKNNCWSKNISSNFLLVKRNLLYTSNYLKLNYIHIPQQNNETQKSINLIVLHGMLGNSFNFYNLLKNNKQTVKLCNQYLLDLRNFGNSPHSNSMSYSDMAGDVMYFINYYNLSQNCVLMGHSMGAKVVMQMLSQFKTKLNPMGVIIIDMMPINYSQNIIAKQVINVKEILKKLCQVNLENTSMNEIRRVINQITKGNKAITDLITTNIKYKQGTMSDYEWKSNIPIIYQEFDKTLENIQQTDYQGKRLILIGELSNYVDIFKLHVFKTIFPNFNREKDVSIIKGASHWIHNDKPREMMAQVNKFLLSI